MKTIKYLLTSTEDKRHNLIQPLIMIKQEEIKEFISFECEMFSTRLMEHLIWISILNFVWLLSRSTKFHRSRQSVETRKNVRRQAKTGKKWRKNCSV